MPQSDIQWLMFLFFAVGALGGIVYLVQQVLELVSVLQMARSRSRRE